MPQLFTWNDQKYSSFSVSKTRVAPLKSQTIPRLELLSAVLLSGLVVNVMTSLNTRLSLEDPRCFTDSQDALFWIKGIEKEWKPFVQHRVNKIRRLVPTECWGHCAGNNNPADIPSRGLAALELSVNKLWNEGPEWLQTPVSEPSLPDEIPELCVKEIRQMNMHTLLASTQTPNLNCVIDCKRYSTLHRLYRVTAHVHAFVEESSSIARNHNTRCNQCGGTVDHGVSVDASFK